MSQLVFDRVEVLPVQPGESRMKTFFHAARKVVRRVSVLIVGATVLLAGAAMIIAPGPAFIVIPLGLAVLGLEFAWARYWLRRLRVAISAQAAADRAGRADGYRRFRAGRY